MIDLHAHSTASDGRLRPSALMALAAEAGLRVISLTDHDTVAGLGEARAAAQALGLRLVNGIEITAVEAGRDVHVLGYFINPDSPELETFLQGQRDSRIRRLEGMAARLRALNCDVDVSALLQEASRHRGRSVGRPLLADALVAAGHAVSRRDAFDRLIGLNGPAYVPRSGAPVDRVIAVIRKARGVASLAHPVRLCWDEQIPRFAAAGLGALEVRHRDHDSDAEAHYREMARRLGLAVSGGTDFHGDSLEGRWPLGSVTLDEAELAALEARAVHAEPGPMPHESGPVLIIKGVQKNYHSLRPLRIQELTVAAGERIAISGVDAGASEVLINLVTGASLPDQGEVVVLGQATSGIRDADAWLNSLDRFGIVSERAVLLNSETVEQNLAMPFTLRDPVPSEIAERVAALARECGIDGLDRRVGDASADVRARLHLARAVALASRMLIIEHIAAGLPDGARAAFADLVVRVTDARRLAALILTEDRQFAMRVAHRALTLQPATGVLKPVKRGWFR